MLLTEDMSRISVLIKENEESAKSVDESMKILENIVSGKSGNNDKSNFDEINNQLTSFREQLATMRELRSQIEKLASSNSNEDGWILGNKIYQEQYSPASEKIRNEVIVLNDSVTKILEETTTQTLKESKISLVVSVCLAILFIITSIITTKRIVREIVQPLKQIEDAANALAKGNFDVKITYNKDNEFGQVCKSIKSSFSTLKNVIGRISEDLYELSQGNFTIQPAMEFPGGLRKIEESEVVLIEKLNTSFNKIKSSVVQIKSNSNQVSQGSQSLAQGATEQASSIQELSATLMEISNRVATNSQNSKEANQLAILSGEVAHSTIIDMENMVNSIQDISISSESIGKIIKVIDDIAFQTNILALNAAVEAARAGSAGKGFAVVADEVRNLAQKSSDAAKETTTLIENSMRAVKSGEEIAEKTNIAFQDLVGKVNQVVKIVDEISVASEEQANNIKEITTGVEQISCVVQANSATSEESAATSEELLSQAYMLSELVKQFNLKEQTEEFLTDMGTVSSEEILDFEESNLSNDKYGGDLIC